MKPTLYARITDRLQNHRLVVALLLLGTVIMGLSAFTDATKNLAGLVLHKKPNPEEARLKLASLAVEFSPVEFVERAGAGDLTAVKLFLAAGMDPNVILYEGSGPDALFVAARANRLPVVKTLLEAGAKVIQPGCNGVAAGAQSGNPELLNLLLKTPADPSHVDEAFTVASNRRMLEILLAHGADVKKAGPLALLYANDPEVVTFLIAHGADINAKDATGRSLLERMDYDTMTLDTLAVLIERKADLNSRDRKGWSLLQTCAWKGYVSGLEMLIAKGVPLEARNPEGRTALSLASAGKYSNARGAVQFLVEHGADVNAADNAGRTPLFHARQRAPVLPEIVQLLSDHGAKDASKP